MVLRKTHLAFSPLSNNGVPWNALLVKRLAWKPLSDSNISAIYVTYCNNRYLSVLRSIKGRQNDEQSLHQGGQNEDYYGLLKVVFYQHTLKTAVIDIQQAGGLHFPAPCYSQRLPDRLALDLLKGLDSGSNIQPGR